MEKLLHYVWKFRLYGLSPLTIETGEPLEILDPGLHNNDAGPDFLNAKVKIGTTVWAGNIEIHDLASDWVRHGHHTDPAYNNVVLHVVGKADAETLTAEGRALPQFVLKIPQIVQQHYDELCLTADYPRCWRIIKSLPKVMVHTWLSALLVERIAERAQLCLQRLHSVQGSWEHTAFITLSRNFGFGLNGDTMEVWSTRFPFYAAQKHRDNLLQLQALFLGSANLLERVKVDAEQEFWQKALQQEWKFLSQKFSLQPLVKAEQWHYLRLRPQNFPHQRMLQFASLFHRGTATFSSFLEAPNRKVIHALFDDFSTTTIDLFIINTIVPLRYAHALYHHQEEAQEQALQLLEELKAENNFMIRQWQQCGLSVTSAADSQALIQLKRNYCDRHDCLRCRFGYEYLKDYSVRPIT